MKTGAVAAAAVLVKIYMAAVLIAAAIFSVFPFSLVSLALLLYYFFILLRSVNSRIRLLTDYFVFFFVAVLFSPFTGPVFSTMLALPLMVTLHQGLQEVSRSQTYQATGRQKILTRTGVALTIITLVLLLLSLALGSAVLLAACLAATAYIGAMIVIAMKGLPPKPLGEKLVQTRVIAGSVQQVQIDLTSKTRIGGILHLASSCEWLKINPGSIPLGTGRLNTKLHFSPALAGTYAIKIEGYATDRWGLIQRHFVLEPALLYVIPRARYAAWLARKYLEQTGQGEIPLSTSRLTLGPVYGLRRGVEYYGNRPYQPGDSLKHLDWKSSIKHHELISKEFIEFHGQSVIALINLCAGNEEEADKLAYWIVITALTLAHENIPAVLAAYDNEQVKTVTPMLHTRKLILGSLEIAREMVTYLNPVKYLHSPDVNRLRADITRLNSVDNPASRKLAGLLEAEYENLASQARKHPATEALLMAFARAESQSNILVISHRNHDAAALAFTAVSYSRKGNAVMQLHSMEKRARERLVKAW